MPFVSSDAAILSFLLMCIPLQYIIVQYWGNTETGRNHALHEFFEFFGSIPSQYLDWESWRISLWRKSKTESFSSLYSLDFDDPYGESPAVEVMKYRQKDGHFALSPEPRNIHPPHVKYRVGQVVMHKIWNYRGVIIGWDEVAKAPKSWFDELYGDNMKWRLMPNYAVLVDERDRLTPQMTYVPQDHLDVVQNTKVIHSVLDEHFEKFDGAQYIPRPWLKTVYPVD